MATRGRFITLEGGEGAGKSTQIRLLAAALQARGIPLIITREPGGSPAAEAIRALLVTGEPGRWQPLTEAMLMNAARHEHVVTTIRPALDAGTWVLCDRFADSSRAYQGYGHGVDMQALEGLIAVATGGLTPDLTLILDIDPTTGIGRTGGRDGGEDRFERMGADFHARLAQGFRTIAAANPDRCTLIDAARPVAAVQADILARVLERLAP